MHSMVVLLSARCAERRCCPCASVAAQITTSNQMVIKIGIRFVRTATGGSVIAVDLIHLAYVPHCMRPGQYKFHLPPKSNMFICLADQTNTFALSVELPRFVGAPGPATDWHRLPYVQMPCKLIGGTTQRDQAKKDIMQIKSSAT